MVKRIVFYTTIIIAVGSFMACNSGYQSLSHFSKRKYLKKYKRKNVKYVDKIDDRSIFSCDSKGSNNELLSLNIQDEIIIDELGFPSIIGEQEIEPICVEKFKKLEPPLNHNLYKRYNFINKYYPKPISNDYEYVQSQKPSVFKTVLLVLLCFLIPPLAVLIHDKGFTKHFWISFLLLFTYPLLFIVSSIYSLVYIIRDQNNSSNINSKPKSKSSGIFSVLGILLLVLLIAIMVFLIVFATQFGA